MNSREILFGDVVGNEEDMRVKVSIIEILQKIYSDDVGMYLCQPFSWKNV